MSRFSKQTKSQCNRYGISKHEDIIEKYFVELGLPVKRHQVYCFLCLSMFTNPVYGEYPDKCDHCGNSYARKGEKYLYCMPDIVLEDPMRHGKAVVFVNGAKYHTKPKDVAKDKMQISILRKNNWRVFVIDNDEIDHLEHIKHSNRCFLALGIWAAMRNQELYLKAFEKEKEIPALR